MNPGGISSTWCETSTIAAGVARRRATCRSREERLARAEVEARGRLVEEQQVRIGHQRPGDRGPPALARRQRPVGMIGDPLQAEAVEQAARPRSVVIGVDVPPRFGGGVPGGHDERDRRQVGRSDASMALPAEPIRRRSSRESIRP